MNYSEDYPYGNQKLDDYSYTETYADYREDLYAAEYYDYGYHSNYTYEKPADEQAQLEGQSLNSFLKTTVAVLTVTFLSPRIEQSQVIRKVCVLSS